VSRPRSKGFEAADKGRGEKGYRNRWKVKRFFAHAGNYRRFTTRYERLAVTGSAVVNAVCMMLTLSH